MEHIHATTDKPSDKWSWEIVHAPNLKNKIGAGTKLILSLRNSGENPKRFDRKGAMEEVSIKTKAILCYGFFVKGKHRN